MKKIAILVALLAATVSTGASAATIISEDFEAGFTQFTPTGQVQIANGATYNQCCGTSPAYTNNFAAFGGGNVPSGFLSRTFNTVLNRIYTVTFDFGALGGGSEPLTFTAGGTTFTVNPIANNDLFSTFQTTSFTFTGTGTATNLSVTSGGVPNVDAIVDNISISAVPEPAVWGLMILGFGAVGGAMRRRKAVTGTAFA